MEVVIQTEVYDIVVIDDCEYIQSRDYPKFRLCANAAFNYPFEEDTYITTSDSGYNCQKGEKNE